MTRNLFYCLFIFLIGCATPNTPNIDSRSGATESFSLANLQQSVVKGVSTKSDVLVALGTPNIMQMNKNGQEVYVWEKRSYESETASGGGRQVVIKNEKSLTIAITFNSKNVVQDVVYRVSSF